MSDHEYIGRVQKALEGFYQHELGKLLNKIEQHEVWEARGAIKAIKRFGEIIEENKEKLK